MEELSVLKNKYYLVDVDVLPGRLDVFHEYWAGQLEERRANGAEHVGTWSVVAGEERPRHVQSLFKIHDFNAWIQSEVHKYDSGALGEMVKNFRLSILHLEANDRFEEFLQSDAGGRYYYWEDIELKANMQDDFLTDLKKPNSKMNAELSGECVATFTVLAGNVSTVHIKRLCMIEDPSVWFESESHHYRSDFWEYLAWWSKLTLIEPLAYSRIR